MGRREINMMYFISKDVRRNHRFVSLDSYWSKLWYHKENLITKKKPRIINDPNYDVVSVKELESYAIFDEDFE